MNIRKEIGYALALVNTDLISDELNALQPSARILKGIGYVGSAAAGDSLVELVIGGKSAGKYENSSTGKAIDMTKDVKPLSIPVPANQRVQCVVRTAPGTNPVVIFLLFAPGYSGNTSGRRFYRRSGTSTRRTGKRQSASGGMY